jgi:hypothetical protein
MMGIQFLVMGVHPIVPLNWDGPVILLPTQQFVFRCAETITQPNLNNVIMVLLVVLDVQSIVQYYLGGIAQSVQGWSALVLQFVETV